MRLTLLQQFLQCRGTLEYGFDVPWGKVGDGKQVFFHTFSKNSKAAYNKPP